MVHKNDRSVHTSVLKLQFDTFWDKKGEKLTIKLLNLLNSGLLNKIEL